MALIPRFYSGPFGTPPKFGVKTSRRGYDVTIEAEDDDVTKRSFNSHWPNLCKLKIIGAATSEWTQFQNQGQVSIPDGSTTWNYAISRSGWQQVTPVPVPTGLSYIPIWEERVLDTATRSFYDDYVYPSANSNSQGSTSGARSYHSGPTTTPANTLFFTPYVGVPNTVSVVTENYSARFKFGDPFPGYPAYPAYPAKPTFRPSSVYVIYSNKMGDVS